MNNDTQIHERLAVLETQNTNQSKDIEKILQCVQEVAAGIADNRVEYEGRLAKVETRLKVYAGIVVFITPIISSVIVRYLF